MKYPGRQALTVGILFLFSAVPVLAQAKSGDSRNPSPKSSPKQEAPKDSRTSLQIPAGPAPTTPGTTTAGSTTPGTTTSPPAGTGGPIILPPPTAGGPAIVPPPQHTPEPTTITPKIPPPSGAVVAEGGTIVWSGRLEKGEIVTLKGPQVSQGTVHGALPGVPVMIDVDAREFAVAEAPGPSNGWSKIAIRSKSRRHTVITIQWQLLH
jgi:hypothetical protein